MQERGALEALAVAALAGGCCIGLPLLAAAGISVGLLALTGGLAAALVALAAVALFADDATPPAPRAGRLRPSVPI